jgi:hypothetical protein
MGNHELNALAFHTPDPNKPGEYLRPHNEKNSYQHAETMRQVPASELTSYLNWFRTLPLWLDLDGLRVVHACWDETRMAKISGPISDEFLYSACLARGSLFEPVEAILKGKEAKLPPGATFHDKDGHEQSATRVKWFEPPDGHTYRTYAMASEPIESDLSLPEEVTKQPCPIPRMPSQSLLVTTGSKARGLNYSARTSPAWTGAWPRAASYAPRGEMAKECSTPQNSRG